MKAFFSYFFGEGTTPEFGLFTPAHIAPILLMLTVLYVIFRNREKLRQWKHEEHLRYVLAFALILSDMSYYWRLVGMPSLGANPIDNLPIGVCGWAAIFCSFMVVGKSQFLFDIAYFWLLSGSLFALLTPTPLTYTGPTRFRYYQFWAEHTLGYIAIFSESSMTYLGIVNLESSTMTSVGTMLANGRNYLSTDPYIILFPALFISLLEISFNLFGNGLRDAFNPSLRGAE